MNNTVKLSPSAARMLSDAYVVPQRATSKRRTPWAQELLDARYVEEKLGIGYVITDAGRVALSALDARTGAAS